MTYAIEHFKSISDFTKAISTREENNAFKKYRPKGGSAMKDTEGAARFSGTKDFSEAGELLTYGYVDGCKGLQDMKGIKPVSILHLPELRAEVAGFAPIVPRALAGLPDSMWDEDDTLEMRVQAKKVITIVYDVDFPGFIEAEEIINCGRRVLAIIKSLENEGFRVNLKIVVLLANDANKVSGLTIKIKDAGQNLNPLLVAYPLVHPSMFRRHIFRWIETSKETSYKRYTETYGHCYYADNNELHKCGVLKGNEYYLSGYKMTSHSGCKDVKDLVEYTKKALELK